MFKLTIYTRFPDIAADLIETHYKRLVIPEFVEMIGPIEVEPEGDCLAFPYSYTGRMEDDPLLHWLKWAMNCGLVTSHKLEKVEA